MKFNKFALLVLLALTVGGVSSVAQNNPTDDQLLDAFDKARFVEATSFSIVVDSVADRPDGSKKATVQVFIKEIKNERYSRVEFLSPEDMKGQVYLNTPQGTFFYQPGLASPLKISGRQQVFGDASVIETVGIEFKKDYKVKARRNVTVAGKSALEVDLIANDKSVSFQSAMVTADATTLRPIKSRVFALSGDPLNDTTYQEYAEVNKDSYVKKQLIENQLIKVNKTLFDITKTEAKNFPDDFFDPNKLGK